MRRRTKYGNYRGNSPRMASEHGGSNVHRVLPRCRMAATIVLGLILAGPGASNWAPAQSNRASVQLPASNPFGVQPAKPSLLDSFNSGVKRGWDGLTGVFTPDARPPAPPDPTSLRSGAKPSPRLHVEVARLSEHAGRLDEAEQHYQEALRLAPDDMSAMLNYARLKDRQGKAGEAFELYRRAAETHPQEPSVFNYLGLHYDRRGMPNEAAETFAQAVRLKPAEPLYRNNLAHVLVQLGKLSEAYQHLHAVHGEAVAYYNLGYLLHRRGQRDAAVQHLAAAVRRDPNLTPARQLLAELAPAMAVPGRPVPHTASLPPVLQGPPSVAPGGQPPQSGYPSTGTAPPSVPPRAPSRLPVMRPLHQESLPQGPGYVEPPRQESLPLPRRSSTTLKQPEGIAENQAEMKQREALAANKVETKQPEGIADDTATLKQPEGIATDTAEMNAPFIRLTGATIIQTRPKSE